MITLLRIVGGALLLGGAALASVAYRRYAERQLAELEGFCKLLSHVREKIKVYLEPQSSLLSDFDCSPLEDCGFMPAYRESGSMNQAFKSAEVSVTGDAERSLSSFFESFGRGYKDEEIARAESTVAECLRILERERCEVPREVRLAVVLIASFALAVFILII